MTRILERITATTDVHSHLGEVSALLTHLQQARASSLIVDCGDFFEGTSYYRFGGGAIEMDILTSLYDVVAPGNHGWAHHFAPDLYRLTVCANAVDDASGEPLFRRLHLAQVAGRTVAVTAIIGLQAFDAIPTADRRGHRVTDPGRALVDLLLEHHHEVDSWILLSHSGFEQDLQLADACPFLDVVFSGHCHSDRYAPEPVGDTLVVKGPEHAAGYAVAEPVTHGWAALAHHLPSSPVLPPALEPIGRRIEGLREQLSAPLAPLLGRWQEQVPDRREVLVEVARRLHRGLGTAVVLNDTALRPTRLGSVLRWQDLLDIEPFGNRLVHVDLPADLAADQGALLARLTERAGPLVLYPEPLPQALTSIMTTDYLAQTLTGSRTRRAAPDLDLELDQAVAHVLADPALFTEEGGPL
ncbi:metallophosphoesterase [Streptacidiphilus cavernicola]|uniref:Metallophosphoesterase n=1 Tax=Streptacidiphilus cavernicola TaxID=3342716 RepID=A0ABV6VW03_9ACTN